MRVSYDSEADVLHMNNGQTIVDTATLAYGPDDLAVDLATSGGHDVVGCTLLGALAYLPLGRGYDAEQDVLTIGDSTDDPAFVTENGDLVAYWQVSEADPDGPFDPIGLAVRRASVYLRDVLAALERPSAEAVWVDTSIEPTNGDGLCQ